MCARRSGSILFILFADNFTDSKDTEPYKMDVSFLCQYISRQFKINLVLSFKLRSHEQSFCATFRTPCSLCWHISVGL